VKEGNEGIGAGGKGLSPKGKDDSLRVRKSKSQKVSHAAFQEEKLAIKFH